MAHVCPWTGQTWMEPAAIPSDDGTIRWNLQQLGVSLKKQTNKVIAALYYP